MLVIILIKLSKYSDYIYLVSADLKEYYDFQCAFAWRATLSLTSLLEIKTIRPKEPESTF